MESCLLAFIESSESHTVETLASLITSWVKQQYPHLKISGCVTDNGSVTTLTCTKLKLEHSPSFLHTVQLVVNSAILKVSKINRIATDDMVDIDSDEFVFDERNRVSTQFSFLLWILQSFAYYLSCLHPLCNGNT